MLKEPETIDKDLRKLITDTFVVIMPHIEEGQFYNNEKAIQTIIKEVASDHNIDTKRIYLTGLSRGGHGTWGLASRIPDTCLLYTSPSPRDQRGSRMPSSA